MIDIEDRVPHHPRADMLGLGLHLLHQPRALDHVAEAGIVLDIGGDGQLPAGLEALHHDRLHPRPRAVDRGRKPAGPEPMMSMRVVWVVIAESPSKDLDGM